MLDIVFFSHNKEETEIIEVSTEFHEWLARSEFSRIGNSEAEEMKIDAEVVIVPVIDLEGSCRRKLSVFFSGMPLFKKVI